MIDKNKVYKTRDGREVRIYATDGYKDYPIHGAIMDHGWCFHYWTEDGKGTTSRFDLIEVKPRHKRTVWLNVYDRHTFLYDNRKDADSMRDDDRIEKLEAALREIANGQRDADKSYAELVAEIRIEARKALEGKDD